ncbi:hypothetical protein [Acinetobacter beijerinckii]|uniref:hypothetical protein n=1 Tax=Acinetobacter beijerinckii TaxID=262668 RepID=UPI002404E23D|nr:hypothetical protein [Acinetobacter beijerinckii]
MTNLKLASNGALSTGGNGAAVLSLIFSTYSFLENTELEVAFFSKKNIPTVLSDINLRLRIIDSTTGDEVIKIQGTVDNDPDNLASIVAVADATEEFEQFDLQFDDALSSILLSSAYNQFNSLGRNKEVLALFDEMPPPFDADATFTLIANLVDTPSYLVLPSTDQLSVYVAILRAAEKLNIPLDIEVDSTLTPEQVAQFAESLDAESHQVQLLWSPNVCRPRDAVSLRGRKVPATYIGQYIGDKLLRNARTNAQGFAPIHYAVAWKDYPFKKKALELRPDVVLDEPTLEMLAQAKVNVVRPIKFERVLYVLSDVLTQRQSKNSALRLVNAAEIAMRTKNDAVNILKNHMLKPTEDYLEKASKEIEKYLSTAATSGWLKPAEDLNGKPYAFRLTPDNDFPFERVRLYLARRPEGATRSVVFDEDVLVK